MYQPSSPFGPGPARPASSASRPGAIAGAYKQVGQQTSVATADAHDLVSILLKGVHEALLQGQGALRRGDIPVKCEALSRAARIVEEGLKACLNLQEGGVVAHNLNDLYGFLSLRITQANIRNDEALILQCIKVLDPIRDAWSGIAASVKAERSSTSRS